MTRTHAPLVLVLALGLAACTEAAPSPPRAPHVTVRWLGGPTALLELGDFTLLTDPVFGEGEDAFRIEVNPNTGEKDAPIQRLRPLPEFPRDTLSLVLVSHAHTDHFDPTARRALSHDLPLVLPVHQVDSARAAGFHRADGIDWFEEKVFRAGTTTLRVTAVPARHAHDEHVDRFLGRGNGYWLTVEQNGLRRSVYWTGDTVLFDVLPGVRARFGRPDLLLPHLGGVGKGGALGQLTLDADDCLELVRMFEPGTVVPLHHSTFSLYREPISELVRRWKDVPGVRLVVLDEGEEVAP